MAKKNINTPLTAELVRSLKAGDEVYITGTIYTARDAAHKRICEAIVSDGKAPISLDGEIIYFVGPTPAKPGQAIGSAGPTTSYRMDAYSPKLIKEAGLRGMIGKGSRNNEVVSAMKEKGAVYFAAIGGAGALMSQSIKEAEAVLYDDLGPEAVRKLSVENFPVVVAIDSEGKSLYEDGPKKYRRG